MSISSNCEIICDCGETFEAELWKAVNVSDNPEIKELITLGGFNIVSCPKCKQVFYWEHFFVYQDIENELIAYVYPKQYEKQATEYRNHMVKEFKEVVKSMEEFIKIDFEPTLYFGIEDLVSTLKSEEYIKDEIQILNFISKRIELDLIFLKPSVARNLCVINTIPKIKKSTGDIKKDIISGLEMLLKYNPNLSEYEKLLSRIKKNVSCLDEILMYKKQ
ncbi:MAG: CpXC domain-containing protein [Endomicrobiaceae bacterium]|nr:CpXC domain-containing protein [Endomicrobiaceae bacterium]